MFKSVDEIVNVPFCRYHVFFHDNCIDGFGAAFAVWSRLHENAAFSPINYNNYSFVTQEGVSGVELGVIDYKASDGKVYHSVIRPNTTVIIVDFSIPLDEVKIMARVAKEVVILDHHKTTKEALWDKRDELPANVYLTFDMHRSGAQIAWDYYHPHTKRPEIIDMIGIRDLWKHIGTPEQSRIEALHTYLSNKPKDFNLWAIYVNNPDEFEKAIISSLAMRDLFKEQVKRLSRTAQEAGAIHNGDHIPVLLVNAPHEFASEVGDILKARVPGGFVCVWNYNLEEDKVYVSLRSFSFDVSDFAKRFGGGGHKNAAGFQTSLIRFISIFPARNIKI